MEWYPQATHEPQDLNGGSMVGGVNRGTLHTLEGTSDVAGRDYYHIQFKDTGTSVEIVQWRSFGKAARSLRNGPDPIQTNRIGTYHPQACIIGYAKDSPNLSDRMVQALAEFIVWCELELGVPAVSTRTFQGSEAYGTSGVGRMTIAEWVSYSGWCGHQDVPDSNTHWDPGALPWGKIAATIDTLKGTVMANPAPWAADAWAKAEAISLASATTEPYTTPDNQTLFVFLDRLGLLDPPAPVAVPDPIDADTLTEAVVAEVIERLTNG